MSITTEDTGNTEKEEVPNRITGSIISAAVKVHRALGPGLLESAYEACLAYELARRGHIVERQKPLPVVYEQVTLDCAYRMDLLIDRTILVELKSVETILPIHEAQTLSYLKLSRLRFALMINFNVPILRDGVRRFVYDHSSPCSLWPLW